MKNLCIYVILLCLFFASCGGKEQSIYPPAQVADLSSVMRDWSEMDSVAHADSLDAYRPEITAFMQTLTSDSITTGVISAWSRSLAVARFTPAVDSVFPSREPLRRQLGHILGRAEDLGIDFQRRRYAAVVWGRMESVLFVDSVMLIALNHYLGPEYDGYGRWPVYRRNDKKPERLPYDLAEALTATAYPYKASGEDATLLSRMLYEGALISIVMELVPDASEAMALGYSQEDFDWIKANESDIWDKIVAEKLLYDTSESVADRFIKPSPAVRCDDAVFPGRIGRYIGYRLVRSRGDWKDFRELWQNVDMSGIPTVEVAKNIMRGGLHR